MKKKKREFDATRKQAVKEYQEKIKLREHKEN